MTALCWWIFWVGFWSDLLRPERTAEIVSFEDWRRDPPGKGRAA